MGSHKRFVGNATMSLADFRARREPNKSMYRCVFCHKRFSWGDPCCNPRLLWDSANGNYIRSKHGDLT